MSQSNSAIELKTATSRLLRWRIPLFLALIANVGVLARMAFVPDRAVAGPPTSAVASVATHRSSGNSTATEETTRAGTPLTAPATSAAELATHSPSGAAAEPLANRTGAAMAACLAPLPTEITNAHESAASISGPSTPTPQPARDASELVPTLTDLAANWWPAVESAAVNATRLAAAHHSQTGTLTIGNLQQNGVPVSFLVDGRIYTLHPGESHRFPSGTSWNLQFHRGGAFGNAHQPLSPGEYQFVVSAQGWMLQPSR